MKLGKNFYLMEIGGTLTGNNLSGYYQHITDGVT